MMDLLQTFEDHLHSNPITIESIHPFYEEALNYMLKAKAKRFRPLLLLSIVQAKNPLLIPSALDVALAVEILHTYSLIHDDLPVMDNADLRRGEPTLHKRYDELTATLVGDALNTYAFYLLAKSSLSADVRIALVEILSDNGGLQGMVHGQIIDCYFENKRLSRQELETLHINKTAKLIAAALKMGAVIVDLKPEDQEALYRFGLGLGLLFQIQDDIIDAVCSAEEVGKTTQADEAKNSFVKICGLEEAYQEADELAQELTRWLEHFDEDIQRALAPLVERYIYRHNQFKG